MRLHVRDAGRPGGETVVCVHGLAQHGGIFDPLTVALRHSGRRIVAVDLRGHGASGYEPPWNIGAHVADLLETADALGIDGATWVGHSFGAVVVATLAAENPARVERLVLLDPGFGVTPAQAMAGAERDRQDWSFATVEGATNALLSSAALVAAPPEVVSEYVEEDLVRGSDGRLRFRYCPAALVAAWSELALPPPPVADVPTLLLRPAASAPRTIEQDLRYRRELGSLLRTAVVPHGHNVLWEAPEQTIAAIREFLELGLESDRG